MTDPRSRQLFDGGEWWLVMPMVVKDRAVARFGSMEDAFTYLLQRRQLGRGDFLLEMAVGAAGIEFVAADADVRERYRFPWT